MKKDALRIAVCLAALALSACASMGGGEDGLSLDQAIERSAEQICAELPAGSRVVIAAWESPGEGFSDYLMEELSGALSDRGLELADRRNLAYVYGELNLPVSGDLSDKNARSVGKFLGALIVLTGQFTEQGGSYRYRANAIRVENAVRGSVISLEVRGDEETRRLVRALAGRKTAVKADGAEGLTRPQTAGTFLDRGLLFAGRSDWDTAIADFTEAVRLDGDYAAAYYSRGIAYRGKGDPDRAIADYNQAIRLDGDYAYAYYIRGNAYYNKREYDRAIEDYTGAIRLDGDYALAYNNRGAAYDDKGDHDRAIADYTEAIRLDPAYAYAYNNRGVAYRNKGEHDRAIADYTQAIRLDGAYAAAYNNRGIAYHNKGDLDRAIADYEAALRIDPNYAAAKNNLERARRARERQEQERNAGRAGVQETRRFRLAYTDTAIPRQTG
jgi:tetratricopeptide (TPR) repeat protein